MTCNPFTSAAAKNSPRLLTPDNIPIKSFEDVINFDLDPSKRYNREKLTRGVKNLNDLLRATDLSNLSILNEKVQQAPVNSTELAEYLDSSGLPIDDLLEILNDETERRKNLSGEEDRIRGTIKAFEVLDYPEDNGPGIFRKVKTKVEETPNILRGVLRGIINSDGFFEGSLSEFEGDNDIAVDTEYTITGFVRGIEFFSGVGKASGTVKKNETSYDVSCDIKGGTYEPGLIICNAEFTIIGERVGSGATFDVVIGNNGQPLISISNAGSGYSIGDIVVFEDLNIRIVVTDVVNLVAPGSPNEVLNTVQNLNGLIIGTALPNRTVVDLSGNIIGTIDTSGTARNSNGEIIGSATNRPISGNVIRNFEDELIGVVDSAGVARNFDGKIIGTVAGREDRGSNNVTDFSGNSIGTADASGTVRDLSGIIIGTVGTGGVVRNFEGDVIGTAAGSAPRDTNVIRDLDGNLIGSIDTAVFSNPNNVINSNGIAIGTALSDGTVINSTGTVIGTTDGSGIVRNANGTVIGAISTSNLQTNGGTALSGGIVINSAGTIIGTIDGSGTVRNLGGTVIGTADDTGTARNANGTVIGTASGSEIVRNLSGAIIGTADGTGTVRNVNGAVIGTTDSTGTVRNANGTVIGSIATSNLQTNVAFGGQIPPFATQPFIPVSSFSGVDPFANTGGFARSFFPAGSYVDLLNGLDNFLNDSFGSSISSGSCGSFNLGILASLFGLFNQVSQFRAQLPSLLGSVWNGLTEFATSLPSLLNTLKSSFTRIIDTVVNKAKQSIQNMKRALSNVGSAFQSLSKEFANAANFFSPENIQKIKNVASSIMQNMTEQFQNPGLSIIEWILTRLCQLSDFINNFMNGPLDAISGLLRNTSVVQNALRNVSNIETRAAAAAGAVRIPYADVQARAREAARRSNSASTAVASPTGPAPARITALPITPEDLAAVQQNVSASGWPGFFTFSSSVQNNNIDVDGSELEGAGWRVIQRDNPLLFAKIKAVIEEVGGGPYTITSAFRSVAYNQALRNRGVGAALRSAHTEALALDVVMSVQQAIRFVPVASANGFNGASYYDGSGFLHVDLRANRTAPGARSWTTPSNRELRNVINNHQNNLYRR